VFGQTVTFTATVTSQAGTLTGSVTFTSDGTPLGTVGLAGGKATLTTSGLPAGNHTISATYTGDANFLTSNATLTQTVKPLEGLADPTLNPLMNALSNVITDSSGNKIIGFRPPLRHDRALPRPLRHRQAESLHTDQRWVPAIHHHI
jgi:hypothetical protein